MNTIVPFGFNQAYTQPFSSKQGHPATSLSSPRNGSDFRDTLPLLAFSGRFLHRTSSPEPSPMDSAQADVLEYKIDTLIKQLAACKNCECEDKGACDFQVGLREFHLKEASQFFSNFSNKVARKKPEVEKLAAQYGALLLMDRLGLWREDQPWRAAVLDLDYTQATPKHYEQLKAATREVQDWLSAANTQNKAMLMKDEQDKITTIQELRAQLGRKAALTEDEKAALTNASKAISEHEKARVQTMEALGSPSLSDATVGIQADVANELECNIEGLAAVKRITDTTNG